MQIEHIAIWTRNLEGLKKFYETYFQATASPKYCNPTRQYESYFLQFATGARLELMQMPAIAPAPNQGMVQFTGYAHLAVSVGSRSIVDALTSRLQQDGYTMVSEPRQTGDGYYESCVLDPDGNRMEITE
jgi:lactoylglutathione lyase